MVGLLLAACGGDGADAHLQKAQDALAANDYAAALSATSAGLAAKGATPATHWRLELAQLEAQARSGDAAAAIASLEKMATDHAAQVKGTLFVSTAGQLKEAGNSEGSIQLLDAGLKRYPDDADLTKAIEEAKSGGGAEELEALKALGYID